MNHLAAQEQADRIVQHASALATALGIPDHEMGRAALSLVVVIAERSPDPDGALAQIVKAVGGKK